MEDLRVRTAIRERGLRLEEEWQKVDVRGHCYLYFSLTFDVFCSCNEQRKRELMKDEQYRTVAEQLRSKGMFVLADQYFA